MTDKMLGWGFALLLLLLFTGVILGIISSNEKINECRSKGGPL